MALSLQALLLVPVLLCSSALVRAAKSTSAASVHRAEEFASELTLAQRPCARNEEEERVYEMWQHRTQLLESGELAGMIAAGKYTPASLGKEMRKFFVAAAHKHQKKGIRRFLESIAGSTQTVTDHDSFVSAAVDWLDPVADYVSQAKQTNPAFLKVEEMAEAWAALFTAAGDDVASAGYHNASMTLLSEIESTTNSDETFIALFVDMLESALEEFFASGSSGTNPLLLAYHHATQLIGAVPSTRDHFNGFIGRYLAKGDTYYAGYTIVGLDRFEQESDTWFREQLVAVCDAPAGTDSSAFTAAIVNMNTGKDDEACISSQSMGGPQEMWQLLPSKSRKTCPDGNNCQVDWGYSCGTNSFLSVTYEYDAWWGHHQEIDFLDADEAPEFIKEDITKFCSTVNFIPSSCEFDDSNNCQLCVVKDRKAVDAMPSSYPQPKKHLPGASGHGAGGRRFSRHTRPTSVESLSTELTDRYSLNGELSNSMSKTVLTAEP